MEIVMKRLQSDFLDLGTVHNRATVDINLIDEENRTIPFIMVSKDNSGLRYDWFSDEIYEERLEPTGANLDSLNTFFKDHKMSVDTAIGKVVNKRYENGELKADVVFGTDPESDTIFNKFREGILTDVSIGYTIQEVEVTERENETTEVLVKRFNIHELSAVWKGFDKFAKVGREDNHLAKEVTPNEKDTSLREKRLKRLRLAEAI
jgi:hypothetical protein